MQHSRPVTRFLVYDLGIFLPGTQPFMDRVTVETPRSPFPLPSLPFFCSRSSSGPYSTQTFCPNSLIPPTSRPGLGLAHSPGVSDDGVLLSPSGETKYDFGRLYNLTVGTHPPSSSPVRRVYLPGSVGLKYGSRAVTDEPWFLQ